MLRRAEAAPAGVEFIPFSLEASGVWGPGRDAFLRSAFTLRTTIATSTFIIGVQRSSLAPGMTLLVFFWHEGGRK